MPVLNGRDLIAALRANPDTARMPIILVSSSEGASHIEGAHVFLHKPFDPKVLVATAEELLERAG